MAYREPKQYSDMSNEELRQEYQDRARIRQIAGAPWRRPTVGEGILSALMGVGDRLLVKGGQYITEPSFRGALAQRGMNSFYNAGEEWRNPDTGMYGGLPSEEAIQDRNAERNAASAGIAIDTAPREYTNTPQPRGPNEGFMEGTRAALASGDYGPRNPDENGNSSYGGK